MVYSALTPIFVNFRIFVTRGDLEALPPHWAANSLGKVSRYHCGQVDCCFVPQIVLCLLYCFVFVWCLFQLRLTCSFLPSFCPSISCWLLDVAFPPSVVATTFQLPFLNVGGAPIPRRRQYSHSSASAVLQFLGLGGAPIPSPPRCYGGRCAHFLLVVGCRFFGRARLHSNIVLA